MSNTGRIKYVPVSLLAEIQRVKEHKKYARDSEACNKVAEYSRVGQEVENILKMNFGPFRKVNK
jgi:hypothetical protein